jgi:hypothetical protein
MTAPTFTVGSISDGSATTVSDMLANPLFIPARLYELLNNAFLTDVVFRNAGGNAAGVVAFEANVPSFLSGDPEAIAEFGEIPVSIGTRGTPSFAVGIKRGLAVRVSREMIDENRVDDVRRQMTQLTNTMIRAEERALRALLEAATIPAVTASATWATTGKPRLDIANTVNLISSQNAGQGTEDILGFRPDTLIIPAGMEPALLNNDDFLKVYAAGANAAEDIRYTGRLPGNVMGLDILTSRFWPANRALLIERGVAGFRSDTRPLQVTPMYPEGGGGNGGPTESFRTDTTRKRVLGIDQPKAAAWINGIAA